MRAFDILKRREIVTKSGITYTKRDWRGFFLFLLAGKCTVVINADLRYGMLDLSRSPCAKIFNNKLGEFVDDA